MTHRIAPRIPPLVSIGTLLLAAMLLAACGSSKVVRSTGGGHRPAKPIVKVSQPKYGATHVVQRGDNVYRIATNTAYDALRRRKLITWMPWQDLDHEPADSESADPQETIGTSELVHAALRRMPRHYCAALLLYTQQGLSYAEIAAADIQQ